MERGFLQELDLQVATNSAWRSWAPYLKILAELDELRNAFPLQVGRFYCGGSSESTLSSSWSSSSLSSGAGVGAGVCAVRRHSLNDLKSAACDTFQWLSMREREVQSLDLAESGFRTASLSENCLPRRKFSISMMHVCAVWWREWYRIQLRPSAAKRDFLLHELFHFKCSTSSDNSVSMGSQ